MHCGFNLLLLAGQTGTGLTMAWSTASGSTWALGSGRTRTGRRTTLDNINIWTELTRTSMWLPPQEPQPQGRNRNLPEFIKNCYCLTRNISWSPDPRKYKNNKYFTRNRFTPPDTPTNIANIAEEIYLLPHSRHSHTTMLPDTTSASTATAELDDLMTSLNNFKVVIINHW